MKKKLIFCFDLDNVICKTKKNYYRNSKPIYNSIDIVNKLYLLSFEVKNLFDNGRFTSIKKFLKNYNQFVEKLIVKREFFFTRSFF
jgi:hypothetical protein